MKLSSIARRAFAATPLPEAVFRHRAKQFLTVLGYHRIMPPAEADYAFNEGVISATPHTAPRSPSVPPIAAITTLSVSSWRTMRARPAPRARRIAISRCRTDDRASRRLATLAHAMRSTQPTAASSVSSAGRTLPMLCQRPRDAAQKILARL